MYTLVVSPLYHNILHPNWVVNANLRGDYGLEFFEVSYVNSSLVGLDDIFTAYLKKLAKIILGKVNECE